MALCAAQATAVTVGDLVAGLCQPAQEALGSADFSSLSAALDAASAVDVGGALSLSKDIHYCIL